MTLLLPQVIIFQSSRLQLQNYSKPYAMPTGSAQGYPAETFIGLHLKRSARLYRNIIRPWLRCHDLLAAPVQSSPTKPINKM
jgi:hypothetical protein